MYWYLFLNLFYYIHYWHNNEYAERISEKILSFYSYYNFKRLNAGI